MVHDPMIAAMETQQLLGASEVARLLGKNLSTISRWAKSGRLEPVVVVPGYNGDLLFDPASVEALREGKAA